jgi:hypothetical protein
MSVVVTNVIPFNVILVSIIQLGVFLLSVILLNGVYQNMLSVILPGAILINVTQPQTFNMTSTMYHFNHGILS